MVVNFTQNQALTSVLKARMLPTWGKVLVRSGQKVEADDVVAAANTYPQHFLIDVARGLGLPVEECKKCVKREIGESVKEGSIIAERGKPGRVVRAPHDGTILSIEKGVVLLQSNDKLYGLIAGFSGVVDRVLPEQGVVIDSVGALVQGVWGNGKHGSGSLTNFTSSPNEALTLKKMKSKEKNIVSFAAYCDDPKVFDRAADKEWKGMILGGLPAKFIPQVNDLPYPVLITEGFGKKPINSYTYDLLNSHLGRAISIDAIKPVSTSKDRPELFIPAISDEIIPNTSNQKLELEKGSRVKIIRGKYMGAAGVIAESKIEEHTLFPNGIRCKSVLVEMPNGEKMIFPLANIEVFM